MAANEIAPAVDREPARIAAGRACGTCMMCCKVLHVRDLDKAPGIWCPHARQGQGCLIHGSHPETCRTFYCLWMQDGSLGPEWKPDRAKFALSTATESGGLLIGVDPNFPNAWTKAPYYSQIKKWAREGALHGQFVFVRIGPRALAILPDRDLDLGRVGLDDDIRVSRRLGPAGATYDVTVQKKPAEAASKAR